MQNSQMRSLKKEEQSKMEQRKIGNNSIAVNKRLSSYPENSHDQNEMAQVKFLLV